MLTGRVHTCGKTEIEGCLLVLFGTLILLGFCPSLHCLHLRKHQGVTNYSSVTTQAWMVDMVVYDGYNVPYWWRTLLSDRNFACLLVQRWNELRTSVLAT